MILGKRQSVQNKIKNSNFPRSKKSSKRSNPKGNVSYEANIEFTKFVNDQQK